LRVTQFAKHINGISSNSNFPSKTLPIPQVGVYMGWVNPKNPSNPPKKNPKRWVGLGNWVDMVLENEKPIKNNGFWVKPYPINPLTQ
jgi:hypothetical protein